MRWYRRSSLRRTSGKLGLDRLQFLALLVGERIWEVVEEEGAPPMDRLAARIAQLEGKTGTPARWRVKC